MSHTTDPKDPDLGRGADDGPVPQNKKYLVLSDEELAKGFVRPVRTKYVHVGPPKPKYPLSDLTEVQKERFGNDYVKYEKYPDDYPGGAIGRYYTQAQLDKIEAGGCGVQTVMSEKIAETYARDPGFYGATYCVGSKCQRHLPVNEFMWDDGSGQRVGE